MLVVPSGRVRSPHTMDIPFVFDNMATAGPLIYLWYSLFVRAPGATGERELGWLDMVSNPVLSADGSLLAQSDQGVTGGINYTVLLRKTDGSPVVRLGEGNPLAFTRDNRWLLAKVLTTPAQQWLYPTGVGEPRRLDDGQFESILTGGLLPDGTQYFVCGSLPGKGGRCYIGAMTGGPLTAVTPEGTTQEDLRLDHE